MFLEEELAKVNNRLSLLRAEYIRLQVSATHTLQSSVIQSNCSYVRSVCFPRGDLETLEVLLLHLLFGQQTGMHHKYVKLHWEKPSSIRYFNCVDQNILPPGKNDEN